MGFKSFVTKKALKMKGVSAEQAEEIAKKIDDNPEIISSLKGLDKNKEVKELFEKITKEIDQKKKEGLDEQYAGVLVMSKYKNQIMKHKEELEPLIRLMQK